MPWVAPKTDFVNGDVLTATQMNNIGGDLAMLNGGTTGQVLSKASNANGDFAWTSETDPNAIPKTIVDAKGDIVTATAADTPARLASSGVNGDVLTVDTSTATGLKFAAVPTEIPSQTGNSGKYLTTNGTVTSWATLATSGLNWQDFTSSGTFSVPSGVTKVWVFAVGGGGGGGGRGTGTGEGGGGGGGGGAVVFEPCTVTAGGSVTVTIGAGGTNPTAGQQGGDGGQTSFGTLVYAGGGGGGGMGAPSLGGSNGRAGAGTNPGAGGGAGGGGAGGGGGGASGNGVNVGAIANNLIGGAPSRYGGSGGNSGATIVNLGDGGAGIWGYGGGGGGGGATTPGRGTHGGGSGAGTNGSGTAGTANTGGGGGGSRDGGSGTRSGADGGSGFVRVYWVG